MAGNFKVGMTLTAKDEASQVLEKGQKQVNQSHRRCNKGDTEGRRGAEAYRAGKH